ncbi:3'-exoribonuclease [Fulvitalea axinellae]|uniref:3'-5' exonuclease n=1 Tax=Fulvitalea axinellae TaxID=1182444 RepID=A0AAU9CQ18_9BACT|nr:3'-exoribonuclease [Fulvitalea axinellae]
MRFQTDISKDEINDMPLLRYEGKVTLVNNPDQVVPALEKIRQHDVAGFDTETRPAFRKGQRYDVALVQVAIPGEVFLFRLNSTGLTPDLAEYLANRSFKKVGVALHDDIKDLRRLRDFSPEGFVELGDMTKVLGIKKTGLRNLAAIILGGRVSKSQQTSNWEKPELTEGQIRYAATDAWVSIRIYEELLEEKLAE